MIQLPFDRDRGKCYDHPDPDMWFPEKDEGPKRVQEAVAICNGQKDGVPCPVLDQCAEWGIRRERFGVWGGLTERQRNMIREARRRRLQRQNKRVVRVGEEDKAAV